MALTINNASETEKHEAKQLGDSQNTGQFYNAEKTVEKFVNVITLLIDSKEDSLESRNLIKDPTVTGFKMFFHFSATEGLFADEIYPNSALRFFKDVGDDYRYNLLKVFISRLSEINTNHPWIFHTIEGLREIYTNPWDAISYFHTQNKLTINSYETIDHKMEALNRMWRAIYWDSSRGVMAIPENLREFSMSVYLLDMRVFRTKLKVLRTIDNSTIDNISHVLFDMSNCQFDTMSGGTFLDTVTNMSINEAFNNLTIGYSSASVSGLTPTMTGSKKLSLNELRLVNSTLENGIKESDFNMNDILNTFSKKVIGKIKEYGITQASYFIQQQARLSGLSSDTTNLLKGIITSNTTNFAELAYGNIQGARITNIIDDLSKTKFSSNFNNQTLTGNEPSLSLDTKQL